MAALARRFFELYTLADSLKAYLVTAGFTNIEVRRGFQTEKDISIPMVAVHYLPSSYIEKQLGRSITEDKSYERRLQIDCYMETEPRAEAIGDVCADFLDEFFINIKKEDSTIIGDLYTPDSETIGWDVQPPLIRNAEVLRWRAIITATLRADYHV